MEGNTVAGNSNLHTSRNDKADEFYTKLSLVESELKHYKEFLKGKVVFCNCDDPFESNFFKYFAMNFNVLGLKNLLQLVMQLLLLYIHNWRCLAMRL